MIPEAAATDPLTLSAAPLPRFRTVGVSTIVSPTSTTPSPSPDEGGVESSSMLKTYASSSGPANTIGTTSVHVPPERSAPAAANSTSR